MWHQSGDIENPQKGYYLSISEVPGQTILNSLARKVNFYGNHQASVVKQAGKIKKKPHSISEAIVAIPFYYSSGQKFFNIKGFFYFLPIG